MRPTLYLSRIIGPAVRISSLKMHLFSTLGLAKAVLVLRQPFITLSLGDPGKGRDRVWRLKAARLRQERASEAEAHR